MYWSLLKLSIFALSAAAAAQAAAPFNNVLNDLETDYFAVKERSDLHDRIYPVLCPLVSPLHRLDIPKNY